MWISATEALSLLNVRAQTLYANVSRGKIRTRRDPSDSRRSLYHSQDILSLTERRRGQRRLDDVAEQVTGWGHPIMSSSVSTVRKGTLLYRGKNATDLASRLELEDIACVLWRCESVDWARAGLAPRVPSRQGDGGALGRAMMAIAMRAATDTPSQGRSMQALRHEAAGVLFTLVTSMFGASRLAQGGSISAQLSTAWRRPRAQASIRRALCLLADHELNASTFAVRVAVSTGASLSAGVLAGLATLSGPLHGRATAALAPLLECAGRQGAETVVRECLSRGQALPAFGHPLYPNGDVRAAALLQEVAIPPVHADLSAWVERLCGELPNVDFALACMTRSHDLPMDAPLALYAVGRCVGWLAHALEQAESGSLIRPRARYAQGGQQSATT